MNARSNRFVLFALAIAMSCHAAERKLEELVVADARMRAAFLEDAPVEDAKSMKTVLAEECERVREEPLQTETGAPIDVAWLCGNKALRFLREVLLDGTKVDDGYICDSAGLEYVKFLPLDMIEDQRCVWVSYDYEAKVHDLDLDSQLGAAQPKAEILTETEAKP